MTPGSPEAVAAGCTCSVMDNHHGEGIPRRDGTRYWWIDENCPVHGVFSDEQWNPQPKEAGNG